MAELDESRGCDLSPVIAGRKAKWNVNEKIEGAIGIIAGRRSMRMYNSLSRTSADAGVSCFDFHFRNSPSLPLLALKTSEKIIYYLYNYIILIIILY